jgi:hypothetical protein
MRFGSAPIGPGGGRAGASSSTSTSDYSAIEQKLDRVIEELRAMRQEMRRR